MNIILYTELFENGYVMVLYLQKLFGLLMLPCINPSIITIFSVFEMFFVNDLLRLCLVAEQTNNRSFPNLD